MTKYRMRHLIESASRLSRPVLFFGSNINDIELLEGDISLSTFDEATFRGRYVFECSVDANDITVVRDEHRIVTDAANVTVHHCYDTHCPDDLIESHIVRTLREFKPEPGTHVVLVTGKLAKAGLERVLKALDTEDFTYEIRVMDIAVAAWLTVEQIAEGIGNLEGTGVVMIPGKVQGDEDSLSEMLGVNVLRGPDCYSELPSFLEQSGVELETTGNVKPRIVLFGSEAKQYGDMLSSTYEIPLIDANQVVIQDASEGDETAQLAKKYLDQGEEIPHYLMAEVIRARMIMSDVANGFVMINYPTTPRDAEWLADMKIKPDAYVNLVSEMSSASEVVEHYRDFPGFIGIDVEADDAASILYTKLEEMFQTCIVSE